MTTLIDTPAWLAEFEAGHLFLTNRATGLTLTLKGRRLAGSVRDCLKTHAPDRVAETFSRIAGPDVEWKRHYKLVPGKHGEKFVQVT